ncbi:MAG: autotransporter-associated beta strand repeat-containing protein [Verrucomicrobiaceae bacterium]|nr:autotransporter-associated beta strand repeat-containing protein [Verrucomicrobiaceae bacterium]
MQRPVFKWLIFAACLAMFLAVMAWITARTLGMERQRVAAERDAQVQERIRLALWRMDSLASTLLIRENSRPPGDYQAFRSPDELFTRDNKEITKGKALMPSPLLGEPPEFVLLHFEMMPPASGASLVCSPQVPTGSQLELANNWYAISPQLKYATDRLAKLDSLLKKHPEAVSGANQAGKEREMPDAEVKSKEPPRPAPAAPKAVAEVFKKEPAQPQPPAPAPADSQMVFNAREQVQRSNVVQQQIANEKLNATKTPLRKTGDGTLQLYGDSSRNLSDLYAARSKKSAAVPKDSGSMTPSEPKAPASTPTLAANSSIPSAAAPAQMEKAKSDEPPASRPMLAAKSLANDGPKSRNTVAPATPMPAAAAPATRSGDVASNETVKTESKPASPALIGATGGGVAAPAHGRADASETLKPATASAMKPQVEIENPAGLSRARESEKVAQTDKREERQSPAAKAEPMSLADANTYTGTTVVNGGTLQISGAIAGTVALQTPAPSAEQKTPGDLKPLWLEQELLLVRNASLDGKPRVQGVWVDWEKLRGQLLGAVTDLLPNASLAPALADVAQLDPSALVTLPVKLTAGAISLPITNGWSALQRALAIAWICLAIAAVATALVLHRAMLLSERRGAFVSAVTHELRTPLTTFQLYSEMLADDMVPDAEKRREYLRTLCDESTRLTHLVENVLAYSRIERGRTAARVERITVGDLIARIEPRLRRRCEEVDLTLEVSLPSDIATRVMNVDAMGVEQILFNLVDNACKYAAPKSDPRTLHLELSTTGPRLAFRIRDHGPGISRQHQKRLFQPFEKSATDAAHSAPGVGLGLALCRRLAREMGGDLVLEKTENGACFALTLSL